MARQETKYIVIHCSQTRPSQKDVDAKWIDRVHRERGWTMIGYGKVIKRNGEVQQGRADDAVQAHVKGYNHTAYGVCLVGGALEEDWTKPDNNFTAEQYESLYKVLGELVQNYELDEKKTCPNMNVREYLLNEDIPNYKFQDGLTDEADLAELEDEPTE